MCEGSAVRRDLKGLELQLSSLPTWPQKWVHELIIFCVTLRCNSMSQMELPFWYHSCLLRAGMTENSKSECRGQPQRTCKLNCRSHVEHDTPSVVCPRQSKHEQKSYGSLSEPVKKVPALSQRIHVPGAPWASSLGPALRTHLLVPFVAPLFILPWPVLKNAPRISQKIPDLVFF